MTEVFHCAESTELLAGMRAARQAIGRGELVVIPTDTVYGIGADAFTPEAVSRLLEAKGRGRESPPPVLIPNTETLMALAAEVTEPLQALAEAFWPGPLTIITRANPALDWDLGDAGGTVALRIPDRPIALELLRETGPLAVSSANLSGEPAAGTATAAREVLGDRIAVYLDDGPAEGEASTILDVTQLAADGTGTVRVLRRGPVTLEHLRETLPGADVREGGAPAASVPDAAVPDPQVLEASESESELAVRPEPTASEPTAGPSSAEKPGA